VLRRCACGVDPSSIDGIDIMTAQMIVADFPCITRLVKNGAECFGAEPERFSNGGESQ